MLITAATAVNTATALVTTNRLGYGSAMNALLGTHKSCENPAAAQGNLYKPLHTQKNLVHQNIIFDLKNK